jgi:hypothetical protein
LALTRWGFHDAQNCVGNFLGFPAEEARRVFILPGMLLADPYVSVRDWSVAMTMLPKTGVW